MREFIDFLASNFGTIFESGSEVFLWFFNRAVAASWLILAVIVLRLLLKKAPKWITCALWGICALRLVLPFSLQSALSLIPSAQTVVPETIYDNRPQIDSGIPVIDNNVNEYFAQGTVPSVPDSSPEFIPDSIPETIIGNESVLAEPTAAFNFVSVLFVIWVVGIIALLTYAVVSYIKLKRRVKGASMLEKGVFESTGVASPFILGIFNPKIYLPLNMDEGTKAYVLAHEKAHLSRGDHFLKPLGFVILSLYWFSPLVWVAYILFCRDIELACDEKVVSKLEKQSRTDYAQALLTCAAPKRIISACPLAFGEVSVKDRVKSALSYKKPMLWVIIAGLITAIVVSALFVTDPIGKKTFALAVTDYNSEVNGINLTLSSADVNSEKPSITVKWYNDSDSEFTYGESFSLKRYKNGEYVSCAKGELFFHEIAYVLSPKSSGEHTYHLDGFDISKAGKYRFETGFNGEFTIDFTLTKTNEQENEFTDLTTDKVTNSLTSSDISKDETSSHKDNSSFISKDPVSNNQSQKEETTSRLTVERPDGTKQEVHTSSIPSEEVSSEQSAPETTAENDPAKRKYIMPPDNPAPVEVNRENAHIPVPMSFVSALQEGEAIEYKTCCFYYSGRKAEIDRYISIIDSYDELEEHVFEHFSFTTDAKGEPHNIDEKGKYNQTFFDENVLIALYMVEGTFLPQYEVKSITQKDGQMCISVKRVRAGEGYSMTCTKILIEISKNDIKNIKNIVVYEEKAGRRLLRRDPLVEV